MPTNTQDVPVGSRHSEAAPSRATHAALAGGHGAGRRLEAAEHGVGVASSATALKTSQQSVVGPEQHEAVCRGLCSANKAPGVAVSARASGPARPVAGGVARVGSRDAGRGRPAVSPVQLGQRGHGRRLEVGGQSLERGAPARSVAVGCVVCLSPGSRLLTKAMVRFRNARRSGAVSPLLRGVLARALFVQSRLVINEATTLQTQI